MTSIRRQDQDDLPAFVDELGGDADGVGALLDLSPGVGRQGEGRVAFFLELDAPDALGDHGLGHELELVAVLDELGEDAVVFVGLDAEVVVGGFLEMLGLEGVFEDQGRAFLDEVDLEVAFLDGAAEEGADLVDQVVKRAGEVVGPDLDTPGGVCSLTRRMREATM